MSKRLLVNTDANSWTRIRNRFPGLSDPKRTMVLDLISEDFNIDFVKKLRNFELTDSPRDVKMKKITGKLLYGR